MAIVNQANPAGGQTKVGTPQSPVAAVPGATANNPGMAKIENRVSGVGSRPPKFWLFLGALVVVALVVVVSLAFFVKQKKGVGTGQTPTQTPLAQIVESSPVALPAIKSDEGGADDLKKYFVSISPAFADDFMAQVPEVAKDAYKKYQQTTEPEAKLEAARAFYIYLNNPGAKSNDPMFKEFLDDVKFDLEETLGRDLFGE